MKNKGTEYAAIIALLLSLTALISQLSDILQPLPEIDEDPPEVALIDPNMNDVLLGNITIRGVVWDLNPVDLKVYINGTEMTDSLPYLWETNQTQSNARIFPDGEYNLTLWATDLAGNTNQESISVYINNTIPKTTGDENLDPLDEEAPEIYFLSPIDLYHPMEIIPIRALILDDSNYNFELRINNTLVSSSLPYYWNASDLAYGPGWWNLSIFAEDEYNHSAQTDYLMEIYNATTSEEETETNQWLVQDESSFMPSTLNDWVNFTAIELNLSLSENSTLWLTFSSSRVYTYLNKRIMVRFLIDGQALSQPLAQVQNTGGAGFSTIVLQYGAQFGAGEHQFSVQVFSDDSLNSVQFSSLFIETMG